MPRDTSLADRTRAAGLRVVETAGWQTRGSASFNGRGSVNHHTAGSPRGAAPSLNGVIHGHPGSAPGPLCHALQSREPDGNDIFYIVAAGRANHAGRGGWRGLTGNSTVYGLEIEHTGTEPLPEHRQRLAARWHAAMAKDRFSASLTCQHKEWAPGRKIDAATFVDPNVFRTWVAEYLHRPGSTPEPPPPQPLPKEAGLMFTMRVEDGRQYLIGPQVIKRIDDAGVVFYATVGVQHSNNNGKGWNALHIVARALDCGCTQAQIEAAG
jgi:hypothetical protein